MACHRSAPFRRSPWLAAVAGLAAACAPDDAAAAMASPSSAPSTPHDFGWSTRAGRNRSKAVSPSAATGKAFACTGSVALTPDTPYTRARFNTLYGSTEQAAVPEAVVRARTVADPNADYRSFVRSETCADGRFRFSRPARRRLVPHRPGQRRRRYASC